MFIAANALKIAMSAISPTASNANGAIVVHTAADSANLAMVRKTVAAARAAKTVTNAFPNSAPPTCFAVTPFLPLI